MALTLVGMFVGLLGLITAGVTVAFVLKWDRVERHRRRDNDVHSEPDATSKNEYQG